MKLRIEFFVDRLYEGRTYYVTYVDADEGAPSLRTLQAAKAQATSYFIITGGLGPSRRVETSSIRPVPRLAWHVLKTWAAARDKLVQVLAAS